MIYWESQLGTKMQLAQKSSFCLTFKEIVFMIWSSWANFINTNIFIISIKWQFQAIFVKKIKNSIIKKKPAD